MRWFARQACSVKSFILITTVTPLFLGEVVRTYSWIVVLGNNGFINSVLMQLGIIAQPIQLLFTVTGVTIALVHVSLPVVVVMLAAAIAHIDPAYEKAAESLGAGPVRVFLTVTLPLSGPRHRRRPDHRLRLDLQRVRHTATGRRRQGQHGLEPRLSRSALRISIFRSPPHSASLASRSPMCRSAAMRITLRPLEKVGVH